MALLRKIFDRNPNWRRNNKPYVEPTEEQKEIMAYEERLNRIRRKRAMQKLGMMCATVEAMAPGALERTSEEMKFL